MKSYFANRNHIRAVLFLKFWCFKLCETISHAGAELCVRVGAIAPQNFEIFLNIYNYFNVFKI